MTAIPMPNMNPPPMSASPPLKAGSGIIMGEAGAGKTHSLITLLESGVAVFDLVTDPGGLTTILDQIRKHPRQKELANLFHWRVVSPVATGWQSLREIGNIVSRMGFEDISKLKTGVGKAHQDVYMKVLETCENFVCDHCTFGFGDVTAWDDSRALVIDSLSGINKIMKDHTVGTKPSLHQGEWGIAMSLEEQFMFKLCSDLQCYFIVLAHLDKVTNEITGARDITLAALGNKLAPQLLRLFDEVVIAKKVGDKFFWSTAELGAATKNRSLPISSSLAPSFAPIVEAYRERKKLFGAGTATV